MDSQSSEPTVDSSSFWYWRNHTSSGGSLGENTVETILGGCTTTSGARTGPDQYIKQEPSPPSSPGHHRKRSEDHSPGEVSTNLEDIRKTESKTLLESVSSRVTSSSKTAVVGATSSSVATSGLIKNECSDEIISQGVPNLNGISKDDEESIPDHFESHQLTELDSSGGLGSSSTVSNFHSQLTQQFHHNLHQLHSFRTGALELATLADFSGELAMSLSPKHTQNLLSNHLSSLPGPHTTPFSVTDILSPLEESYRLKGLSLDGTVLSQITSAGSSIASDSTTPPSPYRVSGSSNLHQQSNNSSASTLISLQTLSNNHNNSVASGNSSTTTIGGSQSPVSSTSSSLSAAAAAAAAAMNVPSSSPYTHMHVPQLSHPSAAAAAFSSQYCNGADLHGMTGHYGDVRSSATAAGWYGASATDPRFAST